MNALIAADSSRLDKESKSLELVSIELNSIDAATWKDYEYLLKLTLQNNNLTTLSRHYFNNLSNLNTLLIKKNRQVTYLDADVFAEMPSLTLLDLTENALVSLSASAFSGLTLLTRLILNKNSLSTLSAGVFDPLQNICVISMTDNSFKNSSESSITAALSSMTNSKLVTVYLGANPIWSSSTLTSPAICGTNKNCVIDFILN